ncbi:hypothetical protein BC834DRAFT_828908 [Gloeopeniophorella convolvens]|nr:hypothetical protein BC834DRAFT_828908 [Gloeopeniophorella convolvens]
MKRTHSTALVPYDGSSSSSEAEAETGRGEVASSLPSQPPATKKRKLPALVAHLTPAVPVDDPSKHQGRARTTPHVEGQWASYVYVPIVLRGPLRGIVERAVAIARGEAPSVRLLGTDQGRDDVASLRELHVSLTRPFFLRPHQKEEMKQAVRRVAKDHAPFTASFAAFSDLTNDERTRTFLCLEVGAGHQELRTLSNALTPSLLSFRQKEYYEQPRFHSSFAWTLLDTSIQKPIPSIPSSDPALPEGLTDGRTASFPTIPHLPENIVPALNAELGARLGGSAGAIEVEKVSIRIGKDVFTWELAG